jgi:hypothetical protein
MVACQRSAKEKGSAREGFQALAVAAMTVARESCVEGEENARQSMKLLAFWADTVADWADRMPLRNVFIFGDHSRNGAAPAEKLKIAIEYDENVSDDIMRSWQQENSTGFAELEKALGIKTKLFTDQDYDVWPPIRDAARTPLMTVRKVRVVRIPARAF